MKEGKQTQDTTHYESYDQHQATPVAQMRLVLYRFTHSSNNSFYQSTNKAKEITAYLTSTYMQIRQTRLKTAGKSFLRGATRDTRTRDS